MQEYIKHFEIDLKGVISHYQEELLGIRTNRPSTKLVEDISVEYFGQMTPIKHLGSLSIVPPREIAVSVWDKSVVPNVAKAIEAARLGFSVAVEGSTVHLAVPPLNDERRAEMVKLVKAMLEKERIKVRSIRDEVNKKIKAGETDEDMVFDLKEQAQKLVDATNKDLEALAERKIKEIND